MSALNTVLLLVHLLIALAMVAVVLLQRSEGGALGIGGGGGGFMTGRGKANLLTRVTATLAACFFATSILLTIIGQRTEPKGSLIDKATTSAPATPSGTPAPSSGGTTAPASGTTAPASGTTAPSAGATAPEPAPAAPASGGILDKLK